VIPQELNNIVKDIITQLDPIGKQKLKEQEQVMIKEYINDVLIKDVLI
jgi:hypothetical protein